MIGERAGERYALSERLGSGGTSSVWKARDIETGREVAVKVLHVDATDSPEAIARFDREARLVAGLHSPNVVQLLDRGQLEGRPFLVFELVNGVDLREHLRRRSPMPVAEVVAIGVQVANGLAAAHALRIVHRDLKPGNVLIDDVGRVRVADFGIARALEEPGITQPGRVVGTGEYVSPEQALGKPVDERSDLYALGVLLYEMSTGRPPYRGASFADVAARHVRAEIPSLAEASPEAPAGLCELVAALLQKQPADRPASAADVRDRLRSMLPDLDGTGPVVDVARDASQDAARSLLLVAPVASHLDDVAPWEDVTPPSMDFPLAPRPVEAPIEQGEFRLRPSARANSGATRWVAVGALVVAVGLASSLLLSQGESPTTTAAATHTVTTVPATTSSTPATTTAGASTAPRLAMRSDVAIFDPPPQGDNSENDDQAANAVDGDGSTWWETETYRNDPNLADGKGGVGLIASVRHRAPISAVEVITPQPGFSATVYVAKSAGTPQTLSGWKQASKSTLVRKGHQRIALNDSPAAQHILIWITSLVPAQGGGGYSARIAEVRAFGTPSRSG